MMGFDVGTSRSKVAFVDPAGKAVSVLNARGEPRTPSVVFVPETGDPLIGVEAVEQGYIDPGRCIRNFKPRLGSTEGLLSNGQLVTPTDAAAMLITRLKADAERQLSMEVSEVVATCPANSRDDFKQALKEAFERNGMKVLKLMPEPTAAACAYVLDKASTKMNILVYDLGGGTFDTSIVHVDGMQITVLATEGIPKLGGNDFNDCLSRRVLDQLKAQLGTEPDPAADPLFFLDLDQRIEAAKLSLGSRKEVPVVATCDGRQVVAKVTQDEFHHDIRPLVQQSLEAVDRAVAAAGLTIDKIDRLVMVGGTSRMPFVQEMAANHTGLAARTDIDPEQAVAHGAALECVAELGRQGRTATLHGRAIPTSDAFVRDVTAHSVGCCVVDRSKAKRRLLNSVLIDKNTPIPCQQGDHFCLEHEEQSEAQIEILQGEADADRDDCLLIGDLRLTNLPKEARRTPRIGVEYVIDANGMVTATATDAVSGQQQTVSVDYKKGIKPGQKPPTI